tara:strand:+ start:209 stop:421 length:213 start_codon:yes stop_codon:yes gene_type:complete
MFNLLTKHPAEKNKTYFQHAWFALKISTQLSVCSLVFAVHAVFPFIPIPYSLNLESTALYLFEKNNDIGG